MKKYFSLLLLALSFLFNQAISAQTENFAEYVNPFIGTGGHGHTYPGATLPFGMMQLSPDTRLDGWDGCGGYHFTDDIVYGFSHTHLSGTGVSDYGDVLLMPHTGQPKLNNGADGEKGYRSKFDKNKEIAKAGYYKTYLVDNKIDVELTTTKRAGMHHYQFNKEDDLAHIVVDLHHRDKVIEGGIKVVSNTEIEGVRISDAWAREQHIYFVAEFSQPFQKDKITHTKDHQVKTFSFDIKKDKSLKVRIGISAVNIEGARKNLKAEINHWDFEKIKNDAELEWNKSLSKITIAEEDADRKTIFYSALYHTMIVPNLFQDIDGQYRGMDLKIHQAKDHTHYTIFSLWDTYRTAHPLYTLIEPKRNSDFIKTMLDNYDKGGILPIWELAGNYTHCMIGYHAIPVIADAYIKGQRDFDANKALIAMQHSAVQDKLGLKSYKEYGFIPSGEEAESVSKTLEYAFDDWCIAQMAKAMGREDLYKKYIQRSQYYKNVFDPSTGFMRARINGGWVSPFSPEEVNFHYTEANSWQYSFYVPQDISGFTSLLGGKDQLENKLDELFAASSETSGREQVDITGLIGQYAHGNEPSHHMAYLYNYVNKPWKTQEKVHEILYEMYSEKPDGYSGNEDCGQMSAWYVMSAMGIYPVAPGDGIYNFGTPILRRAKVELENGKSFVIKANNLSKENKYIQKVSWKGEPYYNSFIHHKELMKGGKLIFEMGPNPNKSWGTKNENIASSSIDEYLILPVPYVSKGERAFKNNTTIELDHSNDQAVIYYTLDGTTPGLKSPQYTTPIELSSTTTIQFFSRANNHSSKVLNATFSKIPVNRSIEVNTTYATQYTAGGDNALIDFLKGSADFRVGAWQGYHSVDLDVVIDLGSSKSIKQIALNCLQDENSWIFMPLEVEYFISEDGQKFKSAGVVKNEIDEKTSGSIIDAFELNANLTTRYIKVVAKNRKLCPDWHKGAGGKSWIFADEVIIDTVE